MPNWNISSIIFCNRLNLFEQVLFYSADLTHKNILIYYVNVKVLEKYIFENEYFFKKKIWDNEKKFRLKQWGKNKYWKQLATNKDRWYEIGTHNLLNSICGPVTLFLVQRNLFKRFNYEIESIFRTTGLFYV